ncbi:MAG: leucine-rich repeat domain-containing protein, partial [Gammaproteobacteria bacterium]|nr:leucine-rich repeat domain-containing protein [Gammaproteobacteria bacterium]
MTLVLRGYRDLPPGVTPTTVIAGLPFAVTPTTIEELPFTVAPTTIEFSPLSDTDAEVTDTAVIELMAPLDLDFGDRQVTTMLWEWRMFNAAVDGAAEIRTQYLRVNVRNTETFFLEDADPSPNTITASAVVGTVVAGVRPVARIGRVGATVAATGAEYALTGGGLFTVNSASGVISLARLVTDGDRGRRPVTLTATYRNTSASLPLVISVLHADGGFDICGRTPVVRDEILRRVNEGGGTLDCTDVPAADMASVQTLDFSANPATVETLRADDFDGLSGLTGLNLRSLGLQSLPPDIFRGLANLRMLNLQDSRLTSLPARLLADLEKPAPVTAGFDAGVLIGGVQYRAGGEAITALALDEEASRNLRIEVAGGVRSTWTLVARTDGAAPPTVTPEIVRFSPGADAVIVQLTAPTDGDFDSSTGSVSWAWTMFNAAGAATEIRTQSLRLDVRELEIFEDSNPAPNHINEKAAPGDPVLDWSPRILVRGAVPEGARYRLSSDAGGLFTIDDATGAMSLAPGRALDYGVSTSHQVTVAADVPGVSTVPPLAVVIEVREGLFIRDADTSANIIAATAAAGTNVGGVALSVRFGTEVLATRLPSYSLVAPGGLFGVNPATGLISAARQLRDSDRGSHPVTLTAIYRGRSDSLPLTIEVRPGISICDRTPGVRDEILGVINSRPGGAAYNCHAVLPADLASISTLNLSLRLTGTEALLAHDFDGMTGLANLNLRDTSLTSLPEGIFSDTTNLVVLNLGNNRRLTSLPPDIFGNLGQLQNLDMSSLGVTSLPENIFSGTINLEVLSLAGSGLTSLSTGTFSNLGQLQNLDMSSLGVTSLPENIFSGTANLEVLSLTGSSLTSLPPGIFANLRQLRNLDLSFSGLTSLPPNILMNLDRLESLDLSETPLSELPVHLLADLDRIRPRVLRVDDDVRAAGIQYRERVSNAPITRLVLVEGDRSDILIVPPASPNPLRRPLTLASRVPAELRLTATPPTIRVLADTVVVVLSVLADLIPGDRSGSVSWAWRFNPAEADEVEIRTADLPVSVQDTLGFIDADPAPNQISETAMPGDLVSGLVPQYIVFGDILPNVEYGLSSNAGGLFEITDANTASGLLSLAQGGRLDYTVSSSHEVTVVLAAVGGLPVVVSTPSFTVTIEVTRALALSDTNSLRDTIAATAATGTPVVGVAPQTTLVRGGAIVTEGVAYTLTGSSLFTVSPTSGAIFSARQLTEDDIRDYPVTLTAAYQGGLAHLPLTIEVADGVSVCGRTPVIRDEIVRLVNSGLEARYDCGFVLSARLASITTLNLSGRLDDVTALLADDFAGMTGLENLDLGSLGSAAANPASLPGDIFRDLASLRSLNLRNSRLMPLPPDLLADLQRAFITLDIGPGVRIGGIQYLLDGAAITAPPTLNEGDRLSLQIRAVGGVRSTLTLVFRAAGAPFTAALTAAPVAVEIGPNTNTAVVELTALPNPDFENTAGQVSWAWEHFNFVEGGAFEVRTAQSLQVNVRVTEAFSLGDADPAPNIIAVSAATGTNVAGVAPVVRVGVAAVTTGVEYSLAGSVLFAANSTSGAIFSTGLLTDGNRGRHPVTLTASYRGGVVSLPLTINVRTGDTFYICDRTPVVQREILYRVNTQAAVRSLGIEYGCAGVPTTRMASLQLLDFSGYSTTVETLLDHDFDRLSGLTSLNLSSLGLRSLPLVIFSDLSNLNRLLLGSNNLTSLPPGIFSDLPNLSSLSLSGNNLAPLPPDIFRGLSRLNFLHMHSLGLRSLPPGIFSGLSNLSDLVLENNNLTSLPSAVFSDSTNLTSLSLSYNNLTSLPPGIFRNHVILSSLSLTGNNLASLPPDVFSGLTNLQVLELGDNDNLVLPGRAVADLERQPLFQLEVDRSARIGGIEYYPLNCSGRLGSEPTTELALNAGERRILRIEAADGIPSTLTLAARTDGTPPPTVTPAVARLDPFLDAAFVELTAPNSTSSVSWVWTGAATEIRTSTSLRLGVPRRISIEDTIPAPNQIIETASAGDSVSGWRPQVVVGGLAETAVRYSLSSDAGGLFRIDSATGALSLVSEGRLDYTMSTSHQITVAATATACGATGVTAPPLAVVIEVLAGLVLSDADPSTGTIAANAATGTRVAGIMPVARFEGAVVTDGVMYSLAGPDLFEVNTASGVISAARQLMRGDAGVHPVTLTGIYRSSSASLPLAIEVFPAVSICDRTAGVRDEILRII